MTSEQDQATGAADAAPVAGPADGAKRAARRWVPWAVGVATALVVLLVGLGLRHGTDAGTPPSAGESSSSTTAPSDRPRELAVPSIGLTATVVPIEVDPAGVLTPPPSPEVGWWRESAVPGATRGQMLITGHTIHDGYGVMNRLGDVAPGAMVAVTTDAGTTQYRTRKVVVLSKAELAAHAQRLFGQGRGDGRLVLVTCDDFEHGEYLSNIVLFADPVAPA